MNTFTKEQLIEKLQHRISVASGFPESEKAQMDLELARIALASLEADGTLANEGTLTATQFKPVADLYGLTSPTGSETSFTFDAVEARDFIDGGWSCQEYVELERFQEAVSGNSPVIPGGWVILPAEPTQAMMNAWLSEVANWRGHAAGYRAMIAAAPQQEAKNV
ncbi:TPA: hypothetical protein LZ306_003342 [Enterobacter bugandensis]|uniref:hypothetical protein n=1 Tax=Enterobacter TaxID=547 RepID=UPI0029853AE1|nr:hypothetical protein [Enterobacter bugandensis]HBM7621090.1 hypothetical protein [Enterobacter bugandensis]HCK7257391.1 hypothetical protein [Enterobacter bugandensis]HCK7307124.1 hypothetical protein [Enterobacter bugandensis]HCK7320832.1 hypothetical protein [Enterobacter bugandensis]